MRNLLVLTVVLTLSLCAFAQQPSGSTSTAPSTSGSQATPQTPSTGTAPGAGDPASAGGATVTEGCLSGTAPNFNITDNKGKVYSLTLPQGADPAVLTPHVGESVQVLGAVNSNSIQVSKMAKGTGSCANSKTGEKPQSK